MIDNPVLAGSHGQDLAIHVEGDLDEERNSPVCLPASLQIGVDYPQNVVKILVCKLN